MRLQREILPLQGYTPPQTATIDFGLGSISHAFPNNSFPLAAVHEFLINDQEQLAATGGFVSGILGRLMHNNAAALWIGNPNLFAPSLLTFGLQPSNIIFIHLKSSKDKLWAAEEALKCPGLAAVICETKDFDFTESRRLQLAVEKSRVTGFILRSVKKTIDTTASLSRWQIRSLPSEAPDGMPGIGNPRWQVELLKVRNGKPGTWTIEWSGERFKEIIPEVATPARLIKTA